MILQLAWKNIWRNKKRSLIILFSTIIGVAGGILTNAIFIGMWKTSVEAAINRELSHIQIHDPRFRDEKLINQNISDVEYVSNVIKSTPGIAHFAKRTIIEGMISSATYAGGIKIFGINPKDEFKVTSIHSKLIEGEYLQTTNKNSILIGDKLANKLNVKLNSKIVLTFQGMDNNFISASFKVKGIFKTESTVFDETVCFVNQSDIEELLRNTNLIHEIVIRVEDIDQLDNIKSVLQNKLKNLSVETWKDIAPELSLTTEYLYLELNIFMGIILFGLLFGISNTVMMSVFDRIKEFGVLMAIGMKRIRIFSLIIMESILLSFTGGLIGILIGFTIIQILSKSGIDLSILESGLAAYGISSFLYPKLPFHMYLTFGIMLTITSIIAAITPALKATKLKPAEAIRTF